MRLIDAPVPTGHGRLHDERVAVGRRHRVDDRVDGAEVGVARVRRRRADRDEQQPRVLERVGDVGREVQPLAVLRDELREAGLVDRDLAALAGASIFSASMSMHQTSLPSSAKPAAVTRPT